MYARCDMSSDGGGWTVILRRVAGGTVDFYCKWEDYEDGFGDLRGEFWYGLENIHCLTTRKDMELRIDLRKANGEGITWVYKTFRVNESDDNYRILIGEGEGPGVMPWQYIITNSSVHVMKTMMHIVETVQTYA